MRSAAAAHSSTPNTDERARRFEGTQCWEQWRRHEFESGAPIRRKVPEKNFGVVPLHFFGYNSTISDFGERFRDGQYSLVSFFICCSSTHGAPRAQPFVKVGGTCPRAL